MSCFSDELREEDALKLRNSVGLEEKEGRYENERPVSNLIFRLPGDG